MTYLITHVLALVSCLSQSGARVVYNDGRFACADTWRVAIVRIAADPYDDVRFIERLTETESIRCLSAKVEQPIGPGIPPILTLVRFELLKPAFEGRHGRFVLVFELPRQISGYQHQLLPREGDCHPALAIPVSDSFRLEQDDTARLGSYRALATFWQDIPPAQLQRVVREQMPSLGTYTTSGDAVPGAPVHFTPELRQIAALADLMDPLRRLIVYGRMLAANQCEAEAPLEQALWAARNDPDLDLIGVPSRLWINDTLRTPEHMETDPMRFLVKAEQCAVDKVRAAYVGSMSGGGWDHARLAKLLTSSGKRSKMAIVQLLGYYTKESQWHFHILSPEDQEARLEEFVSHWKQVYHISG